jgi:hypothetical protein
VKSIDLVCRASQFGESCLAERHLVPYERELCVKSTCACERVEIIEEAILFMLQGKGKFYPEVSDIPKAIEGPPKECYCQ